MAEAPSRYCGNCGNELSSDDRFCTGCGKPVHETAVLPTPEADVWVPPLPQQSEVATPLPVEQAEPTAGSTPVNVVEAFMQADTGVKVLLGIAVVVGIVSIGNGSATGVIIMFVLLLAGAFAWATSEARHGGSAATGGGPEEQAVGNVAAAEPARPISEAQRSRLLDEAIGGYLSKGFFVRLRTPTTAQLVKPKKFSFISALLWFLLFGIGIIVYLIYYAAKSDEGVYLQVDEYGNVTATRQRR